MAKQDMKKLTSSHKYFKNTSTHGMILTGYLLNAGRKLQTSEKARKSPLNQAGQKKKMKGISQDPHPWEGALKAQLQLGKFTAWQHGRDIQLHHNPTTHQPGYEGHVELIGHKQGPEDCN